MEGESRAGGIWWAGRGRVAKLTGDRVGHALAGRVGAVLDDVVVKVCCRNASALQGVRVAEYVIWLVATFVFELHRLLL